MDSALEEVEFLALSENRIEVLTVLSEEACTRRELRTHTGASQPTLGRVLSDLEKRQWITRSGDQYTATATGRLIAAEFTELWDTLQIERKLREIVEWLPADSLGFDIRQLRNATITAPSQTKPDAPVQRVLKLLQTADHVRIFSHAFNERSLGVIHQKTLAGEQTFEGVLSPAAVDALAHDVALREQLQDLIATEAAELRLYSGSIPLAVTITDQVTHLLLRDGDGLLRAAVDTDNESVYEWAREQHEKYWTASTPLDVEMLPTN